jgi:outer membrane protein TolC
MMRTRTSPINRTRIARFAAGKALVVALVLLPGLLHPATEYLTLDKALEYAFRNSPSTQEASFRLETSQQNLMAQQAGLKSQFNLTLTPISISNTRNFNDLTSSYFYQTLTKSEARFSITQPIKWTDGTITLSNRFNWQEASSTYTGGDKTRTFNNSLTLRLNQPLFTYNRTKMNLEELELALENSRLNYAVQKLAIERQVTQQFLNLYYLREGVKIAEDEYKNAGESFTIIESKVLAGISARGELYQADLTRSNSLASLENKQIQFENAVDQFKILVGLPLTEDIEVVADIRKSIVAVDVAKALEYGLDNRMELRQAEISIRNALNDLIVAGSLNEFKASVDMTLGLTGVNEALKNIYDSPDVDKLIAVTLNIPIFDWGQKKHVLAASRAQVDIQKLSASEERKQIEVDIRQAHRNLKNQERQIEIAEKNIKNAQLTYEINLQRYKNGDLSSKDMEYYQLQLSQQKLNEVSALINYKLALLDIKIRSLWDFERDMAIKDTF